MFLLEPNVILIVSFSDFETIVLATQRVSEFAICHPSHFHLFLYLYSDIYKVTFVWQLTYTGEIYSEDCMQYNYYI